jgi:hypothetical protein
VPSAPSTPFPSVTDGLMKGIPNKEQK